MNKHTPKPWRVGMNPGPIIYGDKGVHVATMRCGEMLPKDEAFANIRLVLSAPELLEALEALLESAICANASQNWATGLNDEPASFDQARAAIRKAKGEA